MKLHIGIVVPFLWLSATLAAAETQSAITTSLFCIEPRISKIAYASVVKADSAAVEYALQCRKEESGPFVPCGEAKNDTMILTVGPSTMAISQIQESSVTSIYDCTLDGVSSADCNLYVDVISGGFRQLGSSHVVIPNKDQFAKFVRSFTITAGLEKLASTAQAATPKSTASHGSLQTTGHGPADKTGSTPTPTATDKSGDASGISQSATLLTAMFGVAVLVASC